MKFNKHFLALLFTIAVAGCSGGGSGAGGTSGAVAVSAIAVTTAQSLTVGRAMISFTPLIPSGGALPYSYSYTGTLPTELSFSASTGAVTGTPTAIYTTASVVFSVKDANNVVASTISSVLFTVGAASVNIIAIATSTTQNLTAGTAMASFSPLTPSGGAWPYVYSYTGILPTGLSFSASTGAVTGTPAVSYATASLVFSVKDADNVVASTTSSVSFTVVAASSAATDTNAFNTGYAAYTAKNYAVAAAAFDSMIVAFPTSTLLHSAYFYLGKSLYHLNDFSGAIAKFDIVLSSYPSSAFADDALLWKGKSLQRQASIQLLAGNTAGATALFTQARAAYQSVITTYPNTIPTLIPESNYQIGVSYFDEKNYAVARSTLQAVLLSYATSAIADGAQYHLARSMHELARVVPPTTYTFAQARTEYTTLMTGYPTSTWVDNAQYQIGKTYYDELNYVTAIAEFNKVFANYPASTIADSAQYYLARSMHALALATTPTYTLTQARTAYAKLFTSYPASTLVDNAQYQIGKTYYDELNYATAITEFNLVLINYPISSVADGAQYYKARSIHTLALSPTSGYTFPNARDEYARLIKNYPTSIFVDNASYHSAFTYHNSTQCTSELTAMQAFVLKYSMSPMSTLLVATANTHISDLPNAPLTAMHPTCAP